VSLFGRSKAKSQEPRDKARGSPSGITWATNAPSHWPTLITEPLPAPDPKSDREWAVNNLLFIVTITKTLEAAIPGLKVASVSRDYIFPRGVLNVPLEIEEAGKRYPLFLFPQANEKHASMYYGAAALLPRKGVETPIYYAPSPLPQVSPSNPLRPFNLSMLSKSKSTPSGRYAMWWRTDKDPLFKASTALRLLDSIYTTLAGFNSYVLGLMARELGLVADVAPRVGLPDREASIPITGPEYQHMFISASREKGIRFHFSTTEASPEYRDTFLTLFLAFVKSARAELEQRQLPEDPPDPDYENGPVGWWRFAAQVAASKEHESGVSFFGVVEHEQPS
jgi:hypothetical protein